MNRRELLGCGVSAGLLASCGRAGSTRPLVKKRLARQTQHATEADIVVYGATPAGVIAAFAAASLGASVVLIGGWNDRHLGGMMSGGLGWTDFRTMEAFGGYAHFVLDRLSRPNWTCPA